MNFYDDFYPVYYPKKSFKTLVDYVYEDLLRYVNKRFNFKVFFLTLYYKR